MDLLGFPFVADCWTCHRHEYKKFFFICKNVWRCVIFWFRSMAQWFEGEVPVILSTFLSCPKMAAATLTITFAFQAGQAGRGSVSQRVSEDTCSLLIGHACVTWLPWVAGVSGRVGLYLSSLYRRGRKGKRKGNWNKYYMSQHVLSELVFGIFATFFKDIF